MLSEDGQPRVIVAEDDPGNRYVLCRMLGRMGYDAIRATNGEQAVRMARTGDAPIIFMDLNMPGTDGYAAARAIRAEEAGTPLRIVAVTGDATEGARDACGDAGFDAVLLKPVRMDAVEAELGRIRRGDPS